MTITETRIRQTAAGAPDQPTASPERTQIERIDRLEDVAVEDPS